MADFVAVLKKTIDGLSDNTPQLREKVYRKARDTISAKLAAMQPPPPAVVVDRQRKALEEAIKAVEASYSEQSAEDDFDSVLAGLADPVAPAPSSAAEPSIASAAPVAAAAAEPVAPEAEAVQAHTSPDHALSTDDEVRRDLDQDPDDVAPGVPEIDDREAGPSSVAPEKLPPMRPAPRFEVSNDPVADAGDDDLIPVVPAKRAEPPIGRPALGGDAGAQDNRVPPRRRQRVSGGLIAAVIAVVVLAAGGYALWINRDAFTGTGGPAETAQTPQPSAPAGGDRPAGQQQAAVEQPAAPSPQAPQVETVQKFTQRLLSDGREVDEGRAGDTPSVGEGTSMAAASPPPAAPAAAEPTTPAAAGAQTAEQALPVGQRAIFYEEKTTAAQGSAEEGSTVWSVVQELPGADLPPEPAIRAEVRVPGRDMQMRMTIRRNADTSLPASHIVEMIFLTSGAFEGGGIQSVLRMSLKGSEAAPGNPLIGIPAKIADGYFLFALSNNGAEEQNNLQLLLRQSWIDVPISYNSGRRALVTMEKGVPGDKIFQQVVQGWQAAAAQAAPSR